MPSKCQLRLTVAPLGRANGRSCVLVVDGLGATTLAWPGPSAPGTRAVVAAIVAAAATVAAIIASRIDAEPLPTVTLGMTAAVFGAVAGFLVVPGGPAPPNFFLAAAICSAVSAVLMHVTSRGTTLLHGDRGVLDDGGESPRR